MNNVRFIAINDDVDTEKGMPDFTPFKNIMNEWYAKDISKKIRSAYRTKTLKGDLRYHILHMDILKIPVINII